MRTINFEELKILKAHLNNRPFQYEEVYNEVLDHYASSYENSEESLDVKISQMDEEFPNHHIAIINSRYLKDLSKQLYKSHWTVFLGNFQWPQILYTLLIGILCFGVAPLLTLNKWYIFSAWLVLTSIPILLALYYYLRWAFRRITGQTKLKNGHAQLVRIILWFSVLYGQIPNILRGLFDSGIDLLMRHSVATALVLFIGLIMVSSAITFAQTKLKPAIL